MEPGRLDEAALSDTRPHDPALGDTHQSGPKAPLPIEPGAWLAHYELIREVGRGGMGRVFLARDTRLGRLVAIKIVSGQSAAFVERFLIEARATARATHENIVVIHEVGEHGGFPYMVLEYLEGESLARLMARGPVPPSRAVELAVPIARALVRAHGLGIVHRDLKPDNVIVTTAGQVKVLDFGIARVFEQPESGDGGLIGTLPYMAPEQLQLAAVDARTDLWALGIILHEMLTGRHPLAPITTERLVDEAAAVDRPMPRVSDLAPHVPRELARAIERCLQKRPADRWPGADELVAALEPLLPLRRRVGAEDAEPFPGLRPFHEGDAHLFFGRDADVLRVVQRIRERPLTAVVGASGVGKSSLVRAGVIPALKASGETWEAQVIRPGRTPLTALAGLAQHLSRPGHGPVEDPDGEIDQRRGLEARLRDEPGHLGAMLRARARRLDGTVLVFVDQFEELYTLVDDPEERRAFVRALGAIADDPGAPLRVVVSMRADLLARVAEDARFGEDLTRGLVFLAAPDRDGLREALTRPVAQAGYQFESPALVDRMIDDLGASHDALPLLQFAAAMLWDRRDREARTITASAYDAIGGVAGALARHADQVVDGLTPSARRLLRTVLLRLVTADGTRAIVDSSELRALAPGQVDPLLAQLTDARLLVVHGRGDDGSAVELTHESLIASWPTLRRWREESHEDAALAEQLHGVARQWEARGRDAGLLWRGDAAAEARRFLARRADPLLPREDAYLQAVIQHADRAARRRRIMMFGTMLALAAIAAAALIGLLQIRDAEQHARSQADRAQHEATRAHDAEDQARAQLAETNRALAARDAAEVKAGQATERETMTNEELQKSNADLARALTDAQAAGATAEKARVAAETAEADAQAAARKSLADNARITALADEAKKARAEAERLLAERNKRIKELEKELSQINTTLK